MPGGKRLPSEMSMDMEGGWPESSLRSFVERGQMLRSSTEKLPKDGLRTDMWYDEIPQATRQRAGELLQVRLDYEQKRAAHWEKSKEAEDRFGDQVSKRWNRLMAIAGMSVYTGEGLLAKCQMLLDEPIFDDMTGDMGSEEGFFASCLIADIREAVERGAFTA